MASSIPDKMKAAALGGDGVTAIQGLEDHLQLESGQKLLLFGASGGLGHLALQLARRMGAKVLAVASGEDGVELVRRLGADAVVDGRQGDLEKACRDFAPEGFDAALVLARGDAAEPLLRHARKGGRIAYPNGVEPAPKGPEGVETKAYDGIPNPKSLERINELVEAGPFHMEIGRVYALEEAAKAQPGKVSKDSFWHLVSYKSSDTLPGTPFQAEPREVHLGKPAKREGPSVAEQLQAADETVRARQSAKKSSR